MDKFEIRIEKVKIQIHQIPNRDWNIARIEQFFDWHEIQIHQIPNRDWNELAKRLGISQKSIQIHQIPNRDWNIWCDRYREEIDWFKFIKSLIGIETIFLGD